jgi:hypothetical protein
MTAWQYALWGLFGGFAVEGLEFRGAIHRVGGWPWRRPGEPGPLAMLVSVLIRLLVGAGLAIAAGTTGQVSGPFGAIGVGVAAPLLIEQLARQVRLTTLTETNGGQPAVASAQPAAVSERPPDPEAGGSYAN